MFYLIKDGRVVDRSENQFPVHQSFEWVESAERHEPGWTEYADGVFTPIIPPEIPFVPDIRDEALDLLLNAVNLDSADQSTVKRIKETMASYVGR